MVPVIVDDQLELRLAPPHLLLFDHHSDNNLQSHRSEPTSKVKTKMRHQIRQTTIDANRSNEEITTNYSTIEPIISVSSVSSLMATQSSSSSSSSSLRVTPKTNKMKLDPTNDDGQRQKQMWPKVAPNQRLKVRTLHLSSSLAMASSLTTTKMASIFLLLITFVFIFLMDAPKLGAQVMGVQQHRHLRRWAQLEREETNTDMSGSGNGNANANVNESSDPESLEQLIIGPLSLELQAKYASLNYETINQMTPSQRDQLRRQLQRLNAALVYEEREQADAWKSCMLRMIDHCDVIATTSGIQTGIRPQTQMNSRQNELRQSSSNVGREMNEINRAANIIDHSPPIGASPSGELADSLAIGAHLDPSMSEPALPVSTSILADRKCSYTFDGWGCWNETMANAVATIDCPSFVQGFDPMLKAHKYCRSDGTWWTHPDTGKPWSNYTTCVDTADLAFRQRINTIQITGNSISVIVLVVSLMILCSFDNLKCTRNTIHINLFISFIINNTMWIMWYTVVVHDPEILSENPIECRVWHVVLQYFLISNYFWMFCEGIYLLALLVLGFVNHQRIVYQFYAIGWGLPIPPTLLYAYMRATDAEAQVRAFCWMEQTWQSMIITIPVAVSLVLNLSFLIIIVKVLVNKLRAQTAVGSLSEETHQTGKAVKATFILIPLLGLHFMLTPFRPEPKSQWEAPYEILTAISTSFQGVCVAFLFCLTNGEVLHVLSKRWHDFLSDHRLLNANGKLVVPFRRLRRQRSSSSPWMSDEQRCSSFGFGAHGIMRPLTPTDCCKQQDQLTSINDEYDDNNTTGLGTRGQTPIGVTCKNNVNGHNNNTTNGQQDCSSTTSFTRSTP